MSPSEHTGDPDNNISFSHHSDIILALQIVEILIFFEGEGRVTIKVQGRGILTYKYFLSKFLGSNWDP